ncbi:MAG: DUF4332 domain-containing protein [Oscillospiraceae bacterium]|jgi:hypothetical protein|nr:DUF4332 domain-containing protein [Oscillospiraceae bacterium]
MTEIGRELGDIRGTTRTSLKLLGDQDIQTIADLQQKTRSPADRELLSQKIGINLETMYTWAKQADLMRIKGIDTSASALLVMSGIRSMADLVAADTQILSQQIAIVFENDSAEYERNISIEELEAWKQEASGLENEMIIDPDDEPLEFDPRISSAVAKGVLPKVEIEARAIARATIRREEARRAAELDKSIGFADLEQPKTTEGGFFFGLSELIAEIARGVGKAQFELDKSSLAMQNFIDADETLSNYGFSATWYALPETSFSLKVDYAVVNEKTEDGKKNLPGSLRIAPVNAAYQSYFKSTSTIESEMNLKIVPVPPPVMITEPVLVPDLLDLTLEEAKERIREARLSVGIQELINGTPGNGKDTQVIAQSKDAGTEVRVNDLISVAYYKKEA